MKRFIGVNYLHEDGTTSAGFISMDDVARIICTDDGLAKVYYTSGQCDTLTCTYYGFIKFLTDERIIETMAGIL